MSGHKDVAARFKIVPKKAGMIAGVVLLCVFGIWFAETEAFKLATTHQPEPFTELYFEQPTKLPERITADKAYTQSFAIVNHANTAKTYTYKIAIADSSGTQQQTPATLIVPAGQRSAASFTYQTAQENSFVKITVTLLEEQQSIHFRTKS